MKTTLKKISLLLAVLVLSASILNAKDFVIDIIDQTTDGVGQGDVRVVTVEGGETIQYINGSGVISVPGETLDFVVFLGADGYICVDTSYNDPVITIYVRQEL